MEEALGHGVVPTVALAAHTGLYAVLAQELPVAIGLILAATVRLHDQPRSKRALEAYTATSDAPSFLLQFRLFQNTASLYFVFD
jgi:hypothetical protein